MMPISITKAQAGLQAHSVPVPPLSSFHPTPTLNISSSRTSLPSPSFSFLYSPAILGYIGKRSLGLLPSSQSSLPALSLLCPSTHGPAQSNGHIQSVTFSLCSEVFQMPLAVLPHIYNRPCFYPSHNCKDTNFNGACSIHNSGVIPGCEPLNENLKKKLQ